MLVSSASSFNSSTASCRSFVSCTSSKASSMFSSILATTCDRQRDRERDRTGQRVFVDCSRQHKDKTQVFEVQFHSKVKSKPAFRFEDTFAFGFWIGNQMQKYPRLFVDSESSWSAFRRMNPLNVNYNDNNLVSD